MSYGPRSDGQGSGQVELNHVWKKFRYGEVHTRLRDAIPALVRHAFGRSDPNEGLWKGEFWALQNVSFAVRPGKAAVRCSRAWRR